MSDEPEVVSLAEHRAEAEARARAAARARALEQARIDPEALPKPWVTYVLLAANLLVWLVMAGVGVHAFDPQAAELFAWGGNLGLMTRGGQWWRLLTAMFLHAGLMHLAFNLYFLWVVGRITEQIFGAAAFALIYFGSGLLASMASVVWEPMAVSVGASGALFGVFGGFLGFTIRRRSVLPEAFVSSVRKNALILIGLNLAMAVMVPNIDIAGHVGGLVAGLGLGYAIAFLAERPVESAAEARRLKLRALLIVGLACAAWLVGGALLLALP